MVVQLGLGKYTIIHCTLKVFRLPDQLFLCPLDPTEFQPWSWKLWGWNCWRKKSQLDQRECSSPRSCGKAVLCWVVNCLCGWLLHQGDSQATWTSGSVAVFQESNTQPLKSLWFWGFWVLLFKIMALATCFTLTSLFSEGHRYPWGFFLLRQTKIMGFLVPHVRRKTKNEPVILDQIKGLRV